MTIGDVIQRGGIQGDMTRMLRQRTRPYDMESELRVWEELGREVIGDDFRVDEQNRWLYEQLITWARADTGLMAMNPDTTEIEPGNIYKGVYIAGGTGSGKTVALKVLARYCDKKMLKVKDGRNERWLVWRDLLAEEVVDTYMQEGDLKELYDMPIVCIQDIGAERAEAMYMGVRCDVLRTLLEVRGDRPRKITHMTSNLVMSPARHQKANLRVRYGDRAESRVRAMCNYYELRGADRRKSPADKGGK